MKFEVISISELKLSWLIILLFLWHIFQNIEWLTIHIFIFLPPPVLLLFSIEYNKENIFKKNPNLKIYHSFLFFPNYNIFPVL